MVCNFVLNYVTRDFFQDKKFPKNPVLMNMKGKMTPIEVRRFMVGYADDIMIKVINDQEAVYAIQKMKNILIKVGLELNLQKTGVYNLLEKCRFEWLGYTYVVVPKNDLRYTNLISKGQRFTRGKNHVNQSILINYITDSNFKKTKEKIRNKIREAR